MIGIMKSTFRSIPGTSVPLILAFIAFLSISGCTPGVSPQPSSLQGRQALGPARLPEYTAGTTFVYSDGTWDRVIEANPSFVIWENNRGDRSLGSTDFTYRPSKWEGKGIKGHRTFAPTEYLYSGTQSSLWPLAVGNRTHHDEVNKWGVPGIYEKNAVATWKCSVDNTEQVEVPAGRFDTWKIVCSRFSKTTRASNPKTWEEKTFHFAPAIGHWVLLEQTFNDSKRRIRKELVAVLPSLSSLGIDKKSVVGIKEHFQQTLGTSPSGQLERWTDAAKKISFSMTPTATFRLADGTPCRQYEQKLDLTWHSNTYYGIACRSETGLWTVPRR